MLTEHLQWHEASALWLRQAIDVIQEQISLEESSYEHHKMSSYLSASSLCV